MEYKDKQKEIEKELYRAGLLSESYNKAVAKVLTEAGYRKADEAEKRTAKNIAEWLEFRYGHGDPNGKLLELSQMIRKNYGVAMNEPELGGASSTAEQKNLLGVSK